MHMLPLLLAAATLDQTGLAAPPVIQPSAEMVRVLATDGFAPAPPDVVERAADCRARHQLYFLVEGDGRIGGVVSALDRCWRRRTSTSKGGFTIRRWSQAKRPGAAASTLRAVVIRNELFTQIMLGPNLGKGD